MIEKCTSRLYVCARKAMVSVGEWAAGGRGGDDDDDDDNNEGDEAIALAAGPSAGSGLVCDANELKDTGDRGGGEKQVESKHQNAREAEKKTATRKGGWGKRAESADDVLPSESAKFTALGSDAQRRTWGRWREDRGWRHDLLDRADTSFGDRYKDGGPWGLLIGCHAIARPGKAGINDLLCVNC
ncbi:hypothetical protein COCMIDRAFT_36507 [Bipolaris oryzae ATCC 44560]|uniref:Uncharacterized protein n=1 Tax=Bipolaris oryzae ATCC 44560 TaxID=930090 RepID=W6Z7R5_COCMI|nr:uncharacterized protein COCMIDRAFT_36507 [Bipolaris oryzae ATCC 44560]EUC45803.1 hypothetical protein COCMIDRAFT_36507 [Bipolaris oryzae ATCC 44560]